MRRWTTGAVMLALAATTAAGCARETARDARGAPSGAQVETAHGTETAGETSAWTDAPEPGVSETAIRLGQSAVQSGSAREVGRQMQLGIRAAFAEINATGGIDGRRLELISIDDAYEPKAAIENTTRLIEREDVFALIGSTGTPTTRAAAPIAARAEVP